MRLLSTLLNRLVNCSEILLKLPENQSKQISRDFSVGCLLNKNNPSWGSNKAHRNIKIQSQLIQEMADPAIEEKLAPLRASVKEQVSLRLLMDVEMAQMMTQAIVGYYSYILFILG